MAKSPGQLHSEELHKIGGTTYKVAVIVLERRTFCYEVYAQEEGGGWRLIVRADKHHLVFAKHAAAYGKKWCLNYHQTRGQVEWRSKKKGKERAA